MTHDPDAPDPLHRLLDDAVADVEPTDRLANIRARTAARRRTRGWAVAGGAALAAAAVVVAVAVVATRDGGTTDLAAARPSPEPSTGTSSALAPPGGGTTAVYYVGPGPDGPDAPEQVLYRYFAPENDPLELLMSAPADPDYRTFWAVGSLRSYTVTDDAIVVQTTATGAEELVWQQVVYTLQAATRTNLPVRFELADGESFTMNRAPAFGVLSLVQISDPAEGNTYSGPFVARGVGNGFEGSIACRLLPADDPEGEPAWQGVATTAWQDERLHPWQLDVDLTGVEPGTYTLRCQTDDPTGGTEGRGTDVDTRTITVEQG